MPPSLDRPSSLRLDGWALSAGERMPRGHAQAEAAVAAGGGVTVVGTADGAHGPALHVLHLDGEGRVAWVGADATPGPSYGRALASWPAGDLVVTGEKQPDPAARLFRAWALHLAPDGRPVHEALAGPSGVTSFRSAAVLADGTAVAGGEQRGAGWLLAFGPDHQLRWERALPDVAAIIAVAALGDGLAAAAMVECSTTALGGGRLLVLDARGGDRGVQELAGVGEGEPAALSQLEGGDLLMAGQREAPGTGAAEAWAAQLSARGEVLWERRLASDHPEIPRAVVPLPGGGALVAGERLEDLSDRKLHLWCLDAGGRTAWERVHGGTGQRFVRGLARSPEGDLWVVGSIAAAGGTAMWVVRFDGNGVLVWERTLGGA